MNRLRPVEALLIGLSAVLCVIALWLVLGPIYLPNVKPETVLFVSAGVFILGCVTVILYL